MQTTAGLLSRISIGVRQQVRKVKYVICRAPACNNAVDGTWNNRTGERAYG
jgi:hypothetical protein